MRTDCPFLISNTKPVLRGSSRSHSTTSVIRASRDGSFRMEWNVEHRPSTGPFEIAAEAELDLRSVERRRGQMAPERVDMQHREGVAGNLDHVIEALAKAFQRGEIIDPLDAGGFRHPGVVDEVAERMIEIIGRAIDPVRDHEM